MAKKATGKAGGAAKPKPAKSKAAKSQGGPASKAKGKAVAKRPRRDRSDSSASDAIKKLLESPLVADLLAVGATAALAALAEHRFGRGGENSDRRTGKAIKEAGKAAAAAMGRRLGTEFDEIRKASAKAKDGAAK